MIGLDTNVVVRYLTADHPEQSPAARRLIESLDEHSPAFLSLVVIAEVHWVLTSAYKFDRARVLTALEKMLESPSVSAERFEMVRTALNESARGADLADVMIGKVAAAAGCRTTMTFDRRAAHLDGFELLDA